jgi:hypothetical protein
MGKPVVDMKGEKKAVVEAVVMWWWEAVGLARKKKPVTRTREPARQ